MKKKNTLKVKPLRRYNTPVYPSYLDKNPIEHPDTLPYPFTYKALQVLAGAGILVGASCTPTKQVSDNSPVIQSDVAIEDSSPNLSHETLSESVAQKQDSLFNPFPFERLGVPYMPAFFGTGMPSRLRGEEARATINQVFAEEGINFQENYHYKNDSISVVLDGYNPDANIGYIWLDWDKMGNGMVMNNIYYEEVINKCFLTYKVNQIHDLERDLKYKVNQEAYVEKFGKRFEIAQNIENEEEKLLVFKEIYLDYLIYNYREHNTQPFEDDFKNITSESSFEEKEKTYLKQFLTGRIKAILKNYEQKDILMDILNSIIEIEDEKIRKNEYDNFVLFIEKSRRERHSKADNKPTLKILAVKDKQKMAEEIQVFGFNHLDKKLTLQEAKYLENMHKTDEDFIAPISVRDWRFSHSNRLIEHDNGEVIDPKDKVLKALETQVRQYIQWAKQQGGY